MVTHNLSVYSFAEALAPLKSALTSLGRARRLSRGDRAARMILGDVLVDQVTPMPAELSPTESDLFEDPAWQAALQNEVMVRNSSNGQPLYYDQNLWFNVY